LEVAARFLKSEHAGKLGSSVYLFWAMTGPPYFDHNLILNWGEWDSPAFSNFSTEFQRRADVFQEPQARNARPAIGCEQRVGESAASNSRD
jgi:hypothetical protein